MQQAEYGNDVADENERLFRAAEALAPDYAQDEELTAFTALGGEDSSLSLPKNLVRKAKIVAIDHEKSLSELMVDLLTELVEQNEQYAIANRKHVALLAEGFDLESGGSVNWARDSLHDR